MRKFSFRLDTVLRLRSLKLTAERDKLAAALAEAARLERDIAALAEERAASIAFVQNEASAGNTELRALAAYLLGYEARLAQAKAALETARIRVQEQREKVLTADRYERLLIKLKEKRRVEWQSEAAKELETLAQESWNALHFDKK